MRRSKIRALCRVLPAAAGFSAILLLASEARQFTPIQRNWWAFQNVTKPAVPVAKNRSWIATPVDAFVLAKLDEKGLEPNPTTDRITLLRRVSLDLTGLPPTPEETQSFLSDQSPQAYAKVVDRLLASPRYGERWARHWLDLARYADSEGFKADETRPNVWRYRDYVIDSFNSDKPYDRFVKEQIAGDEIYPGDPAALVATGFNRHFPDESNARNLMQRRQELLNDVTDTVGSTFLGLTYGCARCHDHKFDPILQKDYYRLQAFFANTRIEDHAVLLNPSERRSWEEKYAAWDAQTHQIRDEINQLLAKPTQAIYNDNFEKYPDEIRAAITTPDSQRTPYQWQMYHKASWLLTVNPVEAAKRLRGDEATRYRQLQAELAKFDSIKPADRPIAQAMIDNGVESPKTFLLRSGAYDAPLEEVEPGFLSILDPAGAKVVPTANSSGRRTALANWLVDPNNPLTARVMVNRIWQHHFGRGIAGSPSDFGFMGERPVNKELLDYLAASFVENGWSIKKLHRIILLSNTYQQSSNFRKDAATIDPENKYLWRYNRRRLEGESVRDSMLAVSGLLNTKMHGPGVFPPMPVGVVTRGGWKLNEERSETRRRSVYIFVRRNTRYPMLEAFDMPDTHESCGRRNQTITPGQALELLNNDLVFEWAQALAVRVLNDGGMTKEAQVERTYRLAYSRRPDAAEMKTSLDFLDSQTGITGDRGKAFIDFCHMILNSNEFLYIN